MMMENVERATYYQIKFQLSLRETLNPLYIDLLMRILLELIFFKI